MTVTPHLKDCCTLALADGITHLWVTIANGARVEVGDVIPLGEVIDMPSYEKKDLVAGTLTALSSGSPWPDEWIRYRKLLERYGAEAEQYRARMTAQQDAAFVAQRKVESDARVQHQRTCVLAAFHSTGLEPSMSDLLRCAWTSQEWQEIKEFPPPDPLV
jgi:hypothetical protein